MNSGDDIDFERQLRGMELRRPPAEWKALLLPKPVPPLLPKPVWFGLAVCWVVIAGFVIATPEAEDLGPTILPPPQHSATLDNILAYHPDLEQ